MTLVRFSECVLFVDHADTYMETVFPTGHKAMARPQCRPEDIERAYSLGYDGDTWLMTLAHEPLHSFVGELFGMGHSVILWNVAYGDHAKWPEWGREEEGYTTSLQRFINTGERDDLVFGLLDRAREHHGLYENQVFRMVRGLLAEVNQR